MWGWGAGRARSQSISHVGSVCGLSPLAPSSQGRVVCGSGVASRKGSLGTVVFRGQVARTDMVRGLRLTFWGFRGAGATPRTGKIMTCFAKDGLRTSTLGGSGPSAFVNKNGAAGEWVVSP